MSRQRTYQKRTQEPNYYEILGVSQDSSSDEIKTRYKSLVLKFHPDKESSSIAKEAMVSINNAYEALSDPQKRTAYDASLNEPVEETPSDETLHTKPGVLPVVRISKTSLAMIAVALAISILAGYQAETWQGDSKSVSDQFVHANSHYFAAIVHEPLFTLPLFIPGFGLVWGVLGIFIFGFEDKAVLVMTPTLHATSSSLFLLYFVLALAMKFGAYYTGMARSLTLVISIRKRRFSKLDSMFTQADIIIAVILAAVAGLVEHAMVST